MRLLPSKLLRLLILLFLTVFITETVYASSKMAIIPFAAQKSTVQVNAESHAEHCHDMQSHDMQSHLPESAQTNQKQSSHTHCNNHCFACFSMLTQAPLPVFSLPAQLVPNTAFALIYLSPASAQPQKPPIL